MSHNFILQCYGKNKSVFEPKGKFKKNNYFPSRSLQQERIFFMTSLHFSKSREKKSKQHL